MAKEIDSFGLQFAMYAASAEREYSLREGLPRMVAFRID